MTERSDPIQRARLEELRHRVNEIELVLRADGTIVEANDRALHAYGYRREELLRLHVSDLRAPATRSEIRAQMERALEPDGVRFETEHRRRDGTTFPVAVSSRSFVAGGETYLHSLVRDLTEERRLHGELRRLAAAVDQAPASVEITDAQGRLVYVNPAFERITGYGRDEVLGRQPSVVKSGVHPREFYAELWRTVLAGEVWHGRFVNRARDGHLFTEDAVIAPVKDAGGAIGSFVAVKRDVTSELALQQQVSEAQRLDSVAMLAGGVAHDFNNLLTVILSAAETLEHGPAGEGDEREVVEEIRLAAERARDLTQKLLAFARRQVIAAVPLDLNEVVRECGRLLRRVLTEDIALVTSLEPDLWTVRCDPAQVEQVIVNLAVNARDAMPGGGKLSVETANVELGPAEALLLPGLRPGPHVRLVVQDTGTGMAPEVKARAFEPFFTTKPVGKGTGLGLATVHGIVKQSGGHVRLESEPGRGARFELLFPRTLERPMACPSAARSATRGTETVLVVEDDPRVRAITSRALRSGGYEVLVAEEGAEALRIVADPSRRVDLLLSDVVMPGIDGPAFAQLFRSRRPEIRVLFVSGHAHEVLASRGIAEGRAPLLDKPFTPTSLLARIREVLDAA